MKKFVLVCICVLAASLLCAQDVIITKDAQRIEAKIYEVSKTEIRYKEKDNLDGPVFVIPTTDINSITYSNGKVVIYNKGEVVKTSTASTTTAATTSAPQTSMSATNETKATETQQFQVIDEHATINLLSGLTMVGQLTSMTDTEITFIQNGTPFRLPASQIKSVHLSNGTVKEYNSTTPTTTNQISSTAAYSPAPQPRKTLYVTRTNNTYFYNGYAMDMEEYAKFLQRNCPPAYSQFIEGNHTMLAGWILFSVGLGIDIGTLIGAGISGFKNTSPATTAISIIGLGCEIACIPTLCVGYAKMHNSADTFNTSCASKMTSKSYWSINASNNGIGIAYNF